MKQSRNSPFKHLRLLLPEGKDLFSIKEVASVINKSAQFTRDAFKNGKLLGYALKGRSLNKNQGRSAYLIHRDYIVLYLLRHANHSAEDYKEQMSQLLIKGTKAQLKYFEKIIKVELKSRTHKPNSKT